MLNTRALKPSGPPSGKGLTLSQKRPQKQPPKWPWCLPVISTTPGDDRRAPRDREQPRPALGARAGVKCRPLAGPPSPGLHLRGGQSQLPPPPPLPSPGAPAPAGDLADRTRISSGTIVSFHGIVPCSSSAAMVAEAGRRPPSCWLGLELRFLNTCRPAPPCLTLHSQQSPLHQPFYFLYLNLFPQIWSGLLLFPDLCKLYIIFMPLNKMQLRF